MQKEPWKADFELTSRSARLRIETAFPELAPCDVVAYAEGWDNFVVLVNQHLVFRFPRREIAIQSLRHELHVLPQLVNRLPVPIPCPQYICGQDEGDKTLFVGYQRLPGQTAHQTNLTLAERRIAARQLAHFLKVLHGVPIVESETWGVQGDTLGRMDVVKRTNNLNAYLDKALALNLITNPQRILQVVTELPKHDKEKLPRVLVHGDLNFRNFLLSPAGELAAVIDWGDVHHGHPAVDLSVAFSFLPASARTVFWEEYGVIDDVTWALSRFRAVYTNLIILVSAYDVGRMDEVREAERALNFALSEQSEEDEL